TQRIAPPASVTRAATRLAKPRRRAANHKLTAPGPRSNSQSTKNAPTIRSSRYVLRSDATSTGAAAGGMWRKAFPVTRLTQGVRNEYLARGRVPCTEFLSRHQAKRCTQEPRRGLRARPFGGA